MRLLQERGDVPDFCGEAELEVDEGAILVAPSSFKRILLSLPARSNHAFLKEVIKEVRAWLLQQDHVDMLKGLL